MKIVLKFLTIPAYIKIVDFCTEQLPIWRAAQRALGESMQFNEFYLQYRSLIFSW